MARTAQEIADDIAKLKGGSRPAATTAPQTEKSEKPKVRGKNGGRRPGSGRKPLPQDEQKMTLKKMAENFALGEEDVLRIDKGNGTTRKEKMRRILTWLESLHKEAKKGNVSAAKELLDRTLGKSKQPLTGGDEDDTPLRIQGVDVAKLGAKIYDLSDDEDGDA